MKFLLTLVLVLSTCKGYSQKCKYDFEKKDPFSGKQQKGITITLAGFGPAALKMAFQSEDKKSLIGLVVALPGKNENYVERGDTLSIALENGSILSLRSIDRYLPNAQVVGANIMSYFTPMYAVSEEELNKLSTVPMKAVKLKLGAQPLVAEVPAKNGEKAMKAASCIQQ
ncbi:hypothetical protein WSM22_35850 [Cytophagales bacterium WSM2-2]|nr:hypothetical protein WSM22_35850 [Cytophagales bacterium WSM2-2]